MLAEAKAVAILARLASRPAAPGRRTRELLITADQVVCFNGQVREKPADSAQAAAFLAGYSGASVRTVGALRVTDVASGRSAGALDVAEVFFRPIPDATLRELAADPALLGCAGGLMVEHPLLAPSVERIEGGIDSVMGLGKATLAALLLRVLMADGPLPHSGGGADVVR